MRGSVAVADALLAGAVALAPEGSFRIDAKIDGGTCLHWAAWQARAASIEHLLARGANPGLRDDDHGLTPAQWYLHRRDELDAIGNPDCRRDNNRIIRALRIEETP